jgi:Fe-S cluster assembly protein SufD
VRLSGENIDAHLYGLYYAKGDSLIDNHILIDHILPNCQSRQLYKGVLDDEGTGVFNGKILVKQDAQKTNAYQSSKAILLSPEASINSKPQLEIFADDVKCSHGAAIGQLRDDEIFYLESRGIPEKDAKSILTYAFANEIISGISVSELKNYLDKKLKAGLSLEF